jgi:cytochrome c oxidase subunit 1/cytochrome c oxidase subunit I+III
MVLALGPRNTREAGGGKVAEEIIRRPELDVSDLPTIVFGHRSLIWWGTAGLMAIEGTMFAIVVASYFFLRTRVTDWPPGVMPPALIYGIINTVLFTVSVVPNQLAKKTAEKGDRPGTLLWLAVIIAIGIGSLVVRGFEFSALNCQWDANAYASVLWFILGVHTVHLATDWFDTVVLAVLFVTGPFEGKRFMDASENSDYWYFVVFSWYPIWFVLYIVPRLL